MKKHSKLCMLAIALIASTASADVKLASVFTDHMVLQRDKPATVWGTADSGEAMIVQFAEQTQKTKADANGNWRVTFAPLSLSAKPQSLTINNETAASDILVGDVWICSGQSNMKWGLSGTLGSKQIIQSADLPNLRLLQVPKDIQPQPQTQFDAQWQASSPKTVSKFSAVGYLFGHRIQQETNIPIGLIMAAEGSTSVECWVSNETLETDLFAPAIAKWKEVEANWDDPTVRAKHIHKSIKNSATVKVSEARTYPGGCYNGMLHPLFPFAIKGVVWYQGEANRTRAQQYSELFPAMVQEWRAQFEQDDFKFYVVQLPEIGKGPNPAGDSLIAELREVQKTTAEADPFMEMAVIIDSDQNGNIHPKNKQLPGERLALIALAKDYEQAVEYSGPTVNKLTIKGNAAHITFDHLGGGLVCAKRTAPISIEIERTDEPLTNFTIAGADQVFHAASATIEGDSVIVSSDAVPHPVAVRYAWADNPVGCNFYNAAGIPASPFRTDDWPMSSSEALEGNVLIVH